MAEYIPIGEPVNELEREGMRQLRDQLPDHYTVIGNFDLQLPRRKNTLEYDAVVVGEWGVYAVEIRGWGGVIRGDIRRWELEWGRVENPFIRIERKAKALRDVLVRSISDFPDEVFCEAVVFLTGDDPDVRVDDERNERLILPGQLYSYFVDESRLYARGPGPMIDPDFRQKLVDAISPLARPRSPLPVIPDYEVERELPAETRPYREFIGRHGLLKSSGKLRIKAYSMDPLLPRQDQREGYRRVVRDMEALIKLEDNPYVARPWALVRDKKDELTFYLISEWISSMTLGDFIDETDYEQRQGLDDQELLAFCKHLVRAVSYLHEHKITHRNLHPEVIYVTRSSSPVPFKIADFDYARVASLKSIAGQLSNLGTEGYSAPELWKDEEHDHRVDIFSIGAIIFELLTGKCLFCSLPEMLRHEQVWDEKRHWVEDDQLRSVLDQLVSPQPAERSEGLDEAVGLFDDRLA